MGIRMTPATSGMQENFNLPRGPLAVCEQWRARARLGVAVHGPVAWDQHKRVKLAFYTRVGEKGSNYTTMGLRRTTSVLKTLGMFNEGGTLVYW